MSSSLALTTTPRSGLAPLPPKVSAPTTHASRRPHGDKSRAREFTVFEDRQDSRVCELRCVSVGCCVCSLLCLWQPGAPSGRCPLFTGKTSVNGAKGLFWCPKWEHGSAPHPDWVLQKRCHKENVGRTLNNAQVRDTSSERFSPALCGLRRDVLQRRAACALGADSVPARGPGGATRGRGLRVPRPRLTRCL